MKSRCLAVDKECSVQSGGCCVSLGRSARMALPSVILQPPGPSELYCIPARTYISLCSLLCSVNPIISAKFM